jgi:hypothetical protein
MPSRRSANPHRAGGEFVEVVFELSEHRLAGWDAFGLPLECESPISALAVCVSF